MFTRSAVLVGLLAIMTFPLLYAVVPQEGQWKAVEDAMSQGLPKTAIEKLEPIIARAVAEKAYAEAIKAISLKISLEGNIQGNQPQEKIIRMQAEIAAAPAEMKPAMQAVLANWFWHYFQHNRWRYVQRTQTAAEPSDDFSTWDLTRILREIDIQFEKSLSASELLQRIPAAQYDALLEKGNMPDAYRPTLYDILANNALDFYSAGEQAATLSEDAFELSAEGPIFAPVAQFLEWQPETTDQASVTLKAVRLQQELIRFHQDDDDPSARLDVDLRRLNFGNNYAHGEEKSARYQAALRRIADRHADHQISARALHDLAMAVHSENDWVGAHEIAQQGLQRFPDSVGGRRCFNLIQQIETPALQVTTERVWNQLQPTIDVNYRNIDEIHFRLVTFDFEQFVRRGDGQPESLDRAQRIALLQRRPIKAWSSVLPATEDYQERQESLPIPQHLPAGSYFLIASHNRQFDDRDNQVSFSEVWISDLALVTRNHQGDGIVGGFVLDARSGDPVSGAQVRLWQRDQRRRYVSAGQQRSDKNGMFQLRALHQLTQMQLPDGGWPWFPGGRVNDYITLYIATGFGRLRHLGVDVDISPAVKSLRRLDAWADQMYRGIKPGDHSLNHLTTMVALYLYGRSFFLGDQPVADQHREAFDFWVAQAKTHWLKLSYRQSQGHLAVALKRCGQLESAKAIMASIKERSVQDEELGMFWRELEHSWWWYRAPIETQAMMIEAFDEVMNDVQAVEDCKVWLLKQKQTQDWKTTKATADAVYALLLRGSDLLASDTLVDVSLGGTQIVAEDVEAGTGFFEHRFVESDITPQFGQIKLVKHDPGVAWGSVHWQYLEDMNRVTPYEGTPLKLSKQLFVKTNTPQGPTLVAVDGPVQVGDELVVRVVLRADRDLEYVHLKDYRGSGTEPVNVLSNYRFRDGLAYYESTRDTASHFFIDYLPKGSYVFEYSTRVQMRGQYQTGVASIQCMYAPEFNSHSESLKLAVE